MSQSHLDQLRAALLQKGWKITQRLRGEDGVLGAATWEIRRGHIGKPLLIDFAGFGGLGEDISLDDSYGCDLRGQKLSLYFRRVRRSEAIWKSELAAFVSGLDAVS